MKSFAAVVCMLVGFSAMAQDFTLKQNENRAERAALLDAQKAKQDNYDFSVGKFLRKHDAGLSGLDLINEIRRGGTRVELVKMKVLAIGRNFEDEGTVQEFQGFYVDEGRQAAIAVGNVYFMDGLRMVPVVSGKNVIIAVERARFVSSTELELTALKVRMEDSNNMDDRGISRRVRLEVGSQVDSCVKGQSGLNQFFSTKNSSFVGFHVTGAAIKAVVNDVVLTELRSAFVKMVSERDGEDSVIDTCEAAIRIGQLNALVMAYLAGYETDMLKTFLIK